MSRAIYEPNPFFIIYGTKKYSIQTQISSDRIGPDRIWFLILYHSIKNRIFYEEVNQ